MWGRLDFLCFPNCFVSVVFVKWGGHFVVEQMEIEDSQFGPLRTFQQQHDEHVGFGRLIMDTHYQQIYIKTNVFQRF